MTWIDIYGNHRRDCMDCGRLAIEGNRCFVCWSINGGEWNWSNTELPEWRPFEDTADNLYHWNKDGEFVLK